MTTHKWQPIDSAPRSKVVIIRTALGRVFQACYEFGLAVDDSERATWAWIASDDGVHPECWTDGICWKTNVDNEESDQPTHWMPLPDPPKPEPQ